MEDPRQDAQMGIGSASPVQETSKNALNATWSWKKSEKKGAPKTFQKVPCAHRPNEKKHECSLFLRFTCTAQETTSLDSPNNEDDNITCGICCQLYTSDGDRRPMMVCSSGHSLCLTCSRRLNICPICRQQFLRPPIPNRALKQIVKENTFALLSLREIDITEMKVDDLGRPLGRGSSAEVKAGLWHAEEMAATSLGSRNDRCYACNEEFTLVDDGRPKTRCSNGHRLCIACSRDIEECPECHLELEEIGEERFTCTAQETTSLDSPNTEDDNITCGICCQLYTSDGDRRPMMVCSNGHSLCLTCSRRLNICPICRQQFLRPPIPNRALKQIVKENTFALLSLREIDITEMKVDDLGRPLGRGSSAEVKAGLWHGEEVAVKIFQIHENDSYLKALKIESSFATRLQHPNVVRIYGITRMQSDTPAIVMERADKGCLRAFIGKLSYPQKASIARGILEGYAYLHSRKVAHRDLKPENILLFGDRLVPKISDFGTSRIVQTSMVNSMVTGTPKYCAPELLDKGLRYGTLVDNDSYLKALKIESSFATRLQHPNVVRIYGITRMQSDTPAIVMERADKGCLRAFIGKLSYPQKASIARGILEGIAYLHSRKVAHRDLKPENILLFGDKLVPKISDFGTSRIVQTSMVNTIYELLEEGLRYGTPVDVCSLSLILFELFTGEDPFKGCTSVGQVVAAIMRDQRPQIPSDFPESLKPLLEKGWSRDPLQRPPLTRFREALQKVFEDLGKGLAKKTAAQLKRLELETPSPESNPGSSQANNSSPTHSLSFAELSNHERRCFNDQMEELNRQEVPIPRWRRPQLETSEPDSPAASMPSVSRLSLGPTSHRESGPFSLPQQHFNGESIDNTLPTPSATERRNPIKNYGIGNKLSLLVKFVILVGIVIMLYSLQNIPLLQISFGAIILFFLLKCGAFQGSLLEDLSNWFHRCSGV
ncbi:unnamed protein product [Cyprideis torosa]|uniref:Uncharacterized protein n=1 Tax=Cyprideis torosa TaxID=163714 RepID=A0A7R8ZT47_9CRUS|nr:unnamed protein product [Cyprideis torosa]CAG0897192.1 unnamed protein product [Cyprideis torosa]